MPKKKSIEEVRQAINEISNGELKLLSDTYINNKEPLLLECKCGNKFYRCFDKIMRNRIVCDACSRKNKSDMFRADFNEVLKTIQDAGCEYISGEYINNSSVLTLRCSCGNVFTKRFSKFASGQNHCPQCGYKNLSKSKIRYSAEDAKEIFASHGYTLADDYIDTMHKCKCFCSKGHECYITLSGLMGNRGGCKICGPMIHAGEKHHNYNGGISIISDVMRDSTNAWRSEIRLLYNDTCPITGATGDDCVVHHLTSFNTLYREALEESDVPYIKVTKQVKDFPSPSKFYEVKGRLASKHTQDSGILISKDVHRLFHKEYTNLRNTPEQFDEFLRKHYNLSLTDLIKKSESG